MIKTALETKDIHSETTSAWELVWSNFADSLYRRHIVDDNPTAIGVNC
jgi:hypothetical protein